MAGNPVIVVAMKGVIRSDQGLLLVKRAPKDETGAGVWEWPGGKLEFGEALSEGLHREILEETALDVTIDELLYATTFLTSPTRQVVLLTYKCQYCGGSVRLSEEHTDWRWVKPDELHGILAEDIWEDMSRYGVLGRIFFPLR
ncbi:NUDIX hydrolase [Gorillibacterium timonense]|uniref:NUDIX hydrolase n=1 Tax=Gorillibacterium timonense TaxID=1689269 RepID=UPI00071C43F1|nr:NUDIX domain-containing protein [Gorillibacterium timonense]